jgi:hypothetical protein
MQKVKSRITNFGKIGCLVYGALILFSIYCYGYNLVKLIYCDFDAPYKEEAIHALGVFLPPASFITVWF